MRILILTQDDPFYLAENINYLLSNIPNKHTVTGTVLFDVSPFGKRESFLIKMKKTFDVFGLRFFIYYALKFVISKLDATKSIKKTLAKHCVPLIQIEGSINSKKNLEVLKAEKPDLMISIGGNQIFKRPMLDIATHGCINLHTALLPKYRGLMPSFWVLKNNEKYTGVSVFLVDEGIDSGPIIVQKKVEIKNRTQEQLIKHTKQIGMDSILESIEKIDSGNLSYIENPESEMTYFKFPTSKNVSEFYNAGKRFF